jgi:hypothetical protein
LSLNVLLEVEKDLLRIADSLLVRETERVIGPQKLVIKQTGLLQERKITESMRRMKERNEIDPSSKGKLLLHQLTTDRAFLVMKTQKTQLGPSA